MPIAAPAARSRPPAPRWGCYAFFDGLDRFAARDEIDAFYLTDFLARQFDAFVWEPLGLDRHPQLRDMYFGHYRKLVYLAQTDDPALDRHAQDCARRLGLAYERTNPLRGSGDSACGGLSHAVRQVARR